jgi:hypothetical protein
LPNLHGTNKNAIGGIVSLSQDRKRIYYVDQEKNQFTIQAVDLNFKDRNMVDFPGKLTLDGKLLDMFTEGRHVAIFYFDKGTIHEMIIDGLNTSTKRSYVLPASMPEVVDREVTLCREGDFVGVVEAKSILKIFVKDEWITAVRDYDGARSAYTTIARYERSTGKLVVSRTIPTEGKFSSTILDTLVYRTVNSKNVFKLEAFGVTSAKKVHEHKIEAMPAHDKQMVYLREGRANRIGKIESLKHMMKGANLCDPFVIAQYEGDSTLITWGTYYDDNGAMGPAGLGPVAGMIVMAVGTTIKQVTPGPGLSRYFYLTGNVKGGFKLSENPQGLRARIDSFEMAQQKEGSAKKLGYYKFDGYIVSAYYLPKKNKLKLVKFPADLSNEE